MFLLNKINTRLNIYFLGIIPRSEQIKFYASLRLKEMEELVRSHTAFLVAYRARSLFLHRSDYEHVLVNNAKMYCYSLLGIGWGHSSSITVNFCVTCDTTSMQTIMKTS